MEQLEKQTIGVCYETDIAGIWLKLWVYNALFELCGAHSISCIAVVYCPQRLGNVLECRK